MPPELYVTVTLPEFCAVTNPETVVVAIEAFCEFHPEGELLGVICILEPEQILVYKGSSSISSIAKPCPFELPPFPVSVHRK